MTKDDEHLRLLSLFHYIAGGVTGLISLIPVLHLVVGIAVVRGAASMGGGNEVIPPVLIGWFFVIVSGLTIGFGMGMAGCMVAAGRMLARRRRYFFCLVVAGLECLMMPIGTVLGVFTILVLLRESVKQTFDVGSASPQPAPAGIPDTPPGDTPP